MELSLHNKKVLVSGSTAGIGFAIARAFAAEGAQVFLNGRDQQKTEQAVSRVKKENPAAQAEGIVADLATSRGFDTLTKKLPQVDILVNNLGIFEPVPFFESTDEDWQKMFNVNVLSGVSLSRFYMPAMLKNNHGRIIFISSESALQVPTEMIHYGMSKTAQLAVANGLAQLTQGTGVTVNSVLPGPTMTEGVDRFLEDLATSRGTSKADQEKLFFKETRPLSLLQRFIQPEEVAASVLFLAGASAAATNGAALRVDGGILKGLH